MSSSSIPAPYLSHIGSHALNTYAIGGVNFYRANDLARTLGITPAQALRRTEHHAKLMHFAAGSSTPVWFINHTGLYNLIFKSDTPNAQALRVWVKAQIAAYLQQKRGGN